MDAFTVHTGQVLPLRRSNVDTDQIIPSDFLKRIGRTGFAEGLFRQWRDEGGFILDEPSRATASLLVAGPDFGIGSSREHAVWALQEWGFRAIVSPRFGDIFRGNALNNGLLPVEVTPAAVEELLTAAEEDPHLMATVDLVELVVSWPGRSVPFTLEASARHRLLHGLDDIAVILTHEDQIAAFERGRPAWMPTTIRPTTGRVETGRV